MYRKQLIRLEEWLGSAKRKPLILRGARQVGKSTLVRLFAEGCRKPLAEVNLERYSLLNEVFGQNHPQNLVDNLESLPNIPPITEDTLLFLDELQSTPNALPALRYVYEDMPHLAVLSAGSLLEFALSDHVFSMPVGRVEYLHMGPMTFFEFLAALDESKLLALLQSFTLETEINVVAHQRLLELLDLYYFVGGMPEAVSVYAESRQLRSVETVHQSIIDTYRDDLPKYAQTRNQARMQHVFNYAARNVGQKVKYSHFSSEAKSATIKKDIELLCMARILNKVTHSHCSGLPLQADLEEKHYKLLFLDVGLMNALCGLDWRTVSAQDGMRFVHAGKVAEQFIGQHLQDMLSETANRSLNYWIREGRKNNAEVDYVVALNGQVVPIEIKSGSTGTLKSLHQFVVEKQVPMAVRFDLNLPSIQRMDVKVQTTAELDTARYQLLSLPLYLVERLPDLIDLVSSR